LADARKTNYTATSNVRLSRVKFENFSNADFQTTVKTTYANVNILSILKRVVFIFSKTYKVPTNLYCQGKIVVFF